mgnify:FL=1
MSDAATGKDVRIYPMHQWVPYYYNISNNKLNREYGHIAKWNFISDSIGTVLYIGAATGFTAWVR